MIGLDAWWDEPAYKAAQGTFTARRALGAGLAALVEPRGRAHGSGNRFSAGA